MCIHFIFGAGRSGTTLLSNCLQCHENIIANPESRFLLYVIKEYKPNKVFTNIEALKLLEDIKNIREPDFTDLRLWGINWDKLTATVAKRETISIIELIELINRSSFLYKDSAKIIVDKNPPYVIFIQDLFRWYPNAKGICIVRNYHDNVKSRIRNSIEEINNVWFSGLKWCYYQKELIKAANQMPDRILVVKYETLVDNFEPQMKLIVDFLGLEFDHKMLEFGPQTSYIHGIIKDFLPIRFRDKYEEMHGHLKKSDKPLVNNQIPKLSIKEEKILDYICINTGTNFNYKPKHKIGLMDRYLFFLPYYLYNSIIEIYFIVIKIYFLLPLQMKMWFKRIDMFNKNVT